MNSNEFITSGIIEAYVMGLCSPQEKAEVESMCLQYPEIKQAVTDFETALEKQLVADSTPTPASLDKKILESLSSLETPAAMTQPAIVKKMSWFKLAAAAAVVLLIGSTVLNYTLYNKTKEQELLLQAKNEIKEPATLPAADYSIMKNPAITPVAMYGVGIHSICRCTLFWDKKTGKAYIMIHHLQPSPQGREYQLWAMVDNKPVSVGMVNDKIRDRFIEVPGVPANASGFNVTLEKQGGSPSPTENETYLIGRI